MGSLHGRVSTITPRPAPRAPPGSHLPPSGVSVAPPRVALTLAVCASSTRRGTAGRQSPLAAHAATPAELRERIEAERAGDPFLVLRDGDGAPAPARARRRAPSASRSGAAPATTSRWSGTPRSRACTPSSSASATSGPSPTTACRATARFVNGQRISGRHRLRDGDVAARRADAHRLPRARAGRVAPDRRRRQPAPSCPS